MTNNPYAGWTSNKAERAAQAVAYQQCLSECQRMTADLMRRSKLHTYLAFEEIQNHTWALDNINKILRRHIAQLDARDAARLDAIRAGQAQDYDDDRQLYQELRRGLG